MGKSSLVNAVLNNSKLAVVSKEPGRTQMINYFTIGEDYYLADAPGYGYYKDSQLDFGPLMDEYLSLGKKIVKACYILIDARRGIDGSDVSCANMCLKQGLEVIFVLTKADKINTSEKDRLTASLKKEFPEEKFFFTSSAKFIGLEEVRSDIMRALRAR